LVISTDSVEQPYTAVYRDIDDGPYSTHVDMYYTIMPVLLQLSSWWWALKARNM